MAGGFVACAPLVVFLLGLQGEFAFPTTWRGHMGCCRFTYLGDLRVVTPNKDQRDSHRAYGHNEERRRPHHVSAVVTARGPASSSRASTLCVPDPKVEISAPGYGPLLLWRYALAQTQESAWPILGS